MELLCGAAIVNEKEEIEEPFIEKFFGSFEKSRQKGQRSERRK